MGEGRPARGEQARGRSDEAGQKLCFECGMCCNGDLFVNTWLNREEVAPARELGLPILSNARGKPAFAQPCPLHVDSRCTAFGDRRRPHACNTFQCKLLKRYLSGEAGTDESLAYIRRARSMIAALRDRIGRGDDGAIWAQLIEWDEDNKGRGTGTRLEIGVLIHLLDKIFLPSDAAADVAPRPAADRSEP